MVILGAYCDSSSYIIKTDKCLRFSSESRTWYDARNQCLVTNGDLAVIGNDTHRLLRKFTLNQSYWIGLSNNSWRWFRNGDGLLKIIILFYR